MTSIYGAIETISMRCRWLKTETVDCQKWKLFPLPFFSHSPLPPQPLLKCIKNIWTAFSPLGDLLNCVCKKALPRKWRLHSFYLLDLWQNARESGGREGDWLPTSLVTMTRTVCQRWEIWLQEKEAAAKKTPSRASVIVFLCHTLANANRRALQRAQLQRILPLLLLPSSSSLFILFYAEWQTNP